MTTKIKDNSKNNGLANKEFLVTSNKNKKILKKLETKLNCCNTKENVKIKGKQIKLNNIKNVLSSNNNNVINKKFNNTNINSYTKTNKNLYDNVKNTNKNEAKNNRKTVTIFSTCKNKPNNTSNNYKAESKFDEKGNKVSIKNKSLENIEFLNNTNIVKNIENNVFKEAIIEYKNYNKLNNSYISNIIDDLNHNNFCKKNLNIENNSELNTLNKQSSLNNFKNNTNNYIINNVIEDVESLNKNIKKYDNNNVNTSKKNNSKININNNIKKSTLIKKTLNNNNNKTKKKPIKSFFKVRMNQIKKIRNSINDINMKILNNTRKNNNKYNIITEVDNLKINNKSIKNSSKNSEKFKNNSFSSQDSLSFKNNDNCIEKLNLFKNNSKFISNNHKVKDFTYFKNNFESFKNYKKSYNYNISLEKTLKNNASLKTNILKKLINNKNKIYNFKNDKLNFNNEYLKSIDKGNEESSFYSLDSKGLAYNNKQYTLNNNLDNENYNLLLHNKSDSIELNNIQNNELIKNKFNTLITNKSHKDVNKIKTKMHIKNKHDILKIDEIKYNYKKDLIKKIKFLKEILISKRLNYNNLKNNYANLKTNRTTYINNYSCIFKKSDTDNKINNQKKHISNRSNLKDKCCYKSNRINQHNKLKSLNANILNDNSTVNENYSLINIDALNNSNSKINTLNISHDNINNCLDILTENNKNNNHCNVTFLNNKLTDLIPKRITTIDNNIYHKSYIKVNINNYKNMINNHIYNNTYNKKENNSTKDIDCLKEEKRNIIVLNNKFNNLFEIKGNINSLNQIKSYINQLKGKSLNEVLIKKLNYRDSIEYINKNELIYNNYDKNYLKKERSKMFKNKVIQDICKKKKTYSNNSYNDKNNIHNSTNTFSNNKKNQILRKSINKVKSPRRSNMSNYYINNIEYNYLIIQNFNTYTKEQTSFDKIGNNTNNQVINIDINTNNNTESIRLTHKISKLHCSLCDSNEKGFITIDLNNFNRKNPLIYHKLEQLKNYNIYVSKDSKNVLKANESNISLNIDCNTTNLNINKDKSINKFSSKYNSAYLETITNIKCCNTIIIRITQENRDSFLNKNYNVTKLICNYCKEYLSIMKLNLISINKENNGSNEYNNKDDIINNKDDPFFILIHHISSLDKLNILSNNNNNNNINICYDDAHCNTSNNIQSKSVCNGKFIIEIINIIL